ncbi:ribonuclease BN [Metallosphaera hakonensis]|uniref:Ribonuclease BN n=1 Tax=Metallosphaera hakonensis JCM 8857 = DSM 7519 TaxID=1293036 RepID=A0A2U9IU02_9CREN|nr:ribonuclease BN [Metallosphaera hakonensis]AWR99453.1 ribonuclease BN [Metallosphaera hakonensis JCM 8857 = DSM 7519]
MDNQIFDVISRDILDGNIENAVSLIRELEKKDKKGWNKLVVYLDLKLKGKKISISEIGSNITILDRNGKIESIVLVISENENINMDKIIDILNFSKSMRINVYVAMVDKYGDITYYNLEEISLTK